MQPHLAQFWQELGYAFYALDLRKCGRTIRHHHTPRYVSDLREYFADIDAAVAMITQELGPDIPLTLWAHSQGGLTASLWADRNRHQVSAMVLNGPWLDWYGGPIIRRASRPLVRLIARAFPRLAVRGLTPTPYDRTLDQRAGGAWKFVASWRPVHTRRVYFSWVEAILAGQSALAKVRDLPFPVLVLSATHSTMIGPPSIAGQGDAVLDVWSLRQRARRLGKHVTVRSIKGAWHDATLSPQPIRAQVNAAVRDWLDEVGSPVPRDPGPTNPTPTGTRKPTSPHHN